MKTYIGTKIIQAEPQAKTRVLTNDATVTNKEEGYKVVYEDGYESWSPKAAFEKAYRVTNGMTCGLALEALKQGYCVAREGWNGRHMFLTLQVPDEHSKMTFPYPYFTIPNCEEGTRRIPYAPTIVDIMSEDWVIIELDS